MGKSTLWLLGLGVAVILGVCNGASLSTPATVIAASTENDALVITTVASAKDEELNDLSNGDVDNGEAEVAAAPTEVKVSNKLLEYGKNM